VRCENLFDLQNDILHKLNLLNFLVFIGFDSIVKIIVKTVIFLMANHHH